MKITNEQLDELKTAVQTLERPEYDYPNTAKLIESKLGELTSYGWKELNQLFHEIKTNFYNELCDDGTFCQTVFTLIFDGIIIPSLDADQAIKIQFFDQYKAQLESRCLSARTVNRIMRAFQTKIDREQMYYADCLLYLLLVEGVYDENMKILYSQWKAAKGEMVDPNELANKNLGDIMAEMTKDGFDPLFRGWKKHLRNSIAHARFAFDPVSGKITFKDGEYDKSERKWVENFSEELTVQEFEEKYFNKVWTVCVCNQHLPMLVRIFEIFFAEQNP
ncbi:MAG: hypothetical protein HYU39_05115 [Thaumarchaeota archaeon]|nr:hypothetical protein [Nitrososphaerota archaeon]